MKLGFTYSSDESQALGAFGSGANAASFAAAAGNAAASTEAVDGVMANYINTHGGLGPGCPVALGYHDFHILGSDGFSGETQSECADFAEDQKVFAVFNNVEETGGLIPCLAEHHVVDFFASPVYDPSPSDYKTYQGYVYQPLGMTTYRYGPFIDLLNKYSYFAKGAKVGILEADDGSGHNAYLVNNLWTPALEALGLGAPTVFTYTEGNGSEASIGAETKQFTSAVLRFKSAGVTNLLFTPDGGNAVFLFPPQANSAGFYPRYALTSNNAPETWSLTPASEQKNAMAVSYSYTDVIANGSSSDPNFSAANTIPQTATTALCKQIYAGHVPSGEYIQTMYAICDSFLYLQGALKGASAVTPQTLLAGVNRLAGSYAPAASYANPFLGPPAAYDGASAVRVMLWDTSDTSWNYVSPSIPIAPSS